MSNENFRRELNAAFDQITGSPSPGLRQRVRSSLGQAPERRGPYWIAAIAACVIAAVLVGVLVMANPLNRRPVTSGPGPQVTATPSTSPSPSPATSPSATPSAETYMCTNTTLNTASTATPPPLQYITDMRTGSHGTYDRLTIQFANGVPSQITIEVQSGTTFTTSPLGAKVTLKGQHGILISINGSDLHTSYNGSIDIVTGDPTLAEVRRVQDFEGVVQLGLGVNGTGCYHAYFLTNPDRLVIDVQAG